MKSIITALTASAVIAAAAKVQGSLPMAIGAAGVYLIALALYIRQKKNIEAAEFNRQLEQEDMLTPADDPEQERKRSDLFWWYARYSA